MLLVYSVHTSSTDTVVVDFSSAQLSEFLGSVPAVYVAMPPHDRCCGTINYRVHFRAAYLGLGTPVGLVLKFTAWVHSYRPCMHLEFHPNKFTVTDHQLIY